MLTGSHFYYGSIRKVVAVFGTLFNNISVVRKDTDDKVSNITRVPLAYGPKQKWLARLDEQPNVDGAKVEMKLPRMSFEISSMTYDSSTHLNRNNSFSVVSSTDPLKKNMLRSFAPYRMGMQLSIMAKNQDDALQIVEQILPYFQPEYTVTIKDIEDFGLVSNIPITLTQVQMNEDYEGDFQNRRVIIYTLDFELRVRFYGPTSDAKIIHEAVVTFSADENSTSGDKITLSVGPTDTPDHYTISTTVENFGF